jgi:Protein of unknown function DUF262/Protein of unknown function (DUF1524)
VKVLRVCFLPVNANTFKIGDLLAQRLPFVVPKYQRSYAWEDEEIQDFIRDLGLCTAVRSAGKTRQHFLGGIVSVQYVAANAPGRKYEVVDGQQRLATFGLLFKSLERWNRTLAEAATAAGDTDLSALLANRADRILNEILLYNDEVDGKPVKQLRISLSKADRQFYEALLLGSAQPAPTRSSHGLLLAAANKINELVLQGVTVATELKEKAKFVETLTDAAKDDCYIIHLVSESKHEAYRLFEVLNDRGRNLSEGDLLRSTTLERLESFPPQQNEAEAGWDDILSGNVSETESFLRAYFASYAGTRPGHRTLFDEFVKRFFPDHLNGAEILDRIKDIQKEISIFRRLRDGEWPYDASSVTVWEENRLVLIIDVLKNELILPFVMAARMLEQDKFASVVQVLEKIVFRYINCCRQHPGKLEKILLSESSDIRKDPKSFKLAGFREKLRKLQDSEANDDFFAQRVVQEMVYRERAGNKVLKYFLTTIDQYMPWYDKGAKGFPACDNKMAVLDLSQIQIEHVYPRNAVHKDAALEGKKHNLGNLSFWSPGENDAAANADFTEKLPYYKKSLTRLNQELGGYTKWSPVEVDVQQERMVARAIKIFSV